ncbi:MAG: multicopper oxidase domain-containing protein [Anaerolineae bacterium]|nr:multicopper oxidase domain-containing protein [Anaerolineae bacterium]
MVSRRQFLKLSAATGAGLAVPWSISRSGSAKVGAIRAQAAALIAGLSDPALQPKFVNPVPDALHPSFIYTPGAGGEYTVGVGPTAQMTGLVDPSGNLAPTPLYGYGQGGVYTWPGKTFEIQSGPGNTVVNWQNELGGITEHLMPVDTSLHWAYSLHGYEGYSIANAGIPIITHLHGGHTDYQFDGNPEYFYSPGGAVVGPQWNTVPGGFTTRFVYDNNVPAGNLWYHDHALGITRLNVYAGMAGFYFVRDGLDTGRTDNPLGLPAWPYEKAYAIQDRMFYNDGRLFYPAFPGDPMWVDFIPPGYTGPVPSALAEFFGDHMVVNGKIWPKEDVEPRNYRLHLLNGSDSRFLAIRFRGVAAGAVDLQNAGQPIPFWVIGSDQGLAAAATQTDMLLIGPGERFDVVLNFADPALLGQRVIMENIAADAPFGGKARGLRPSFFPNRQTDRIMAFDVTLPLNGAIADAFNPAAIGGYVPSAAPASMVRRVALFEGMDEYGRLQPLLGTAEPTPDVNGNLLNGAIPWHMATTENPSVGATEIWEIYNNTPDAHPVHLHLVHFDIVDRQKFKADLVPQPVTQHNGQLGSGFAMANIKLKGKPEPASGVEIAPKDMVTALPGEVTRIKATFDKPGRYVWHCHILSHEDHEMMRVLHVGPVA